MSIAQDWEASPKTEIAAPSLRVVLGPRRGVRLGHESGGGRLEEVILSSITLQDAQRESTALRRARVEGVRLLMRVHASRPKSVPPALEKRGIAAIGTARSLGSLLVDAALLSIADGALITFEDESQRDSVVSTLADDITMRGFTVDSLESF
ncbi:hypothetical protein ACQPZ2_29775 [Nocardia pseudovaccinii]|uniref:hypothetical protein n=1 Tax=Nocardia pseudovaccinii TaxID=189540 RepID=UPI003D8B924E